MLPTCRIQRVVRLWGTALLLGAAVVSPQAGAGTLAVTNTNDSGPGSLREAILTSNANGISPSIGFRIPGPGPHAILLASPLPTVTTDIIIDGYSQPGAIVNTLTDGNDAVIKVRIDGSAAGDATAFGICADSVVIRGLSITGFIGTAIAIGRQSNGTACAVPRPDAAVVEGNFIGLAPDGVTAVPNEFGIVVRDSDNARIGGPDAASRNLISANTSFGILVVDAPIGVTIAGNYIGTDRSGLLDRGNGNQGVLVTTSGASPVSIGAAAPNRIAFNETGIRISQGLSSYSGNAIFSSDDLGIDLGGSGVTPNDADDIDTGANGLQNFPVLTSVRRGATAVGVVGTLDRPPGPNPLAYLISVYSSADCDQDGHGEGERFLGSQVVVLPNGAAQTFGIGLVATPPPLGALITATATAANGDTSEFSACAPLQESLAALVVTHNGDIGAGSLRQAITDANANADASVITFDIPGGGPHTISPLSLLPSITAPVLIDGYTQSGAEPNSFAVGDNAVIGIRLDGDAGDLAGGIGICADDVTIRGLSLTRFVAAIGVGAGTDLLNCVTVADAVIEGNFIGLAPDGSTVGANGNGIRVRQGSNSRIGGEAHAQRNLISASSASGVSFANSASGGGLVCNNYIGTDRSGLLDRGSQFGLLAGINTPSLRVGCASPNRIAFNDHGIGVAANAGGADLHANDILANAEFGIDLAVVGNDDGFTPNDPDDVDDGGNGLQNFPVIARVGQSSDTTLELTGTLDVPVSTFNAIYRIAVYENATCDASGHGEGELFLGAVQVRMGGNFESFEIALPDPPAIGAIVSTTATDPDGNTSEFSACATVVRIPQFRDGFEG